MPWLYDYIHIILIQILVQMYRVSYNDHSKLRPPLLLRRLASLPKCSFQCKWVSLMKPFHFRPILTSTIDDLISGTSVFDDI